MRKTAIVSIGLQSAIWFDILPWQIFGCIVPTIHPPPEHCDTDGNEADQNADKDESPRAGFTKGGFNTVFEKNDNKDAGCHPERSAE